MESTIVVKVKYEETLKRFNARVVNEELDLDMDGLTDKVLHLFNFASNTNVTLTYIDEDGDVVTLSDDDDLRDVMSQSLNPLRITVKLNTEKSGSWYAKSSGSSTPIKSPRVRQPLNTSVHELLKSVPGPVSEAVSKLSTNLVSGPTSSSAVVAEVVDMLSRMGLIYLKQVLDIQAEPEPEPGSSIQSGCPGFPVDASRAKDKVGPNVEGQASETLPCGKSEVPNVNGNELDKGKKCAETLETLPPVSLNLNVGPTRDEIEDEVKELFEGPSSRRSDKNKMLTKRLLPERVVRDASGNSSRSHVLPNLNECPFSGTILENDSVVPSRRHVQHFPFKVRYIPSDEGVNVFHRGVRCDGCGVHPITGIRFKSKVKADYDLCTICFEAMGNETDYIRMDRPVIHRQPPYRVRPPPLPANVVKGSGTNPSQPKLDSCFVQDVNILDGTIIAPSTPFTKIWRMKNNGTVMWPRGSHLLWIGGDRLNATPMVELEIPADGFPEDKELDVAVNFIAPEFPGRYISYWRMVSPKGQKFGQRVWVLIQVDASLTLWGTKVGINLNLPLVGNGIKEPLNLNLNEPLVAGETCLAEPQNSDRAKESVQPIADMQSNKDQDLNFPINDTLLVGGGGGGSARLEAYPAIPSPLMDYSDLAQSAAVDGQSADREVSGNNNNVVEQSLLRELEEMGFKQVDLNKEILRMNEYNLEQSVDDLCGVAEWNPILEELKEMGFCDDETNRRLLKKNNGSIKRVVMDLLAGERA